MRMRDGRATTARNANFGCVGVNAGFIEPNDPRWAALLMRARHDVYHLPAYSVVAARHEGGTPAAFYAESDGEAFLVPLLIRDLPAAMAGADGCRDATSPYGYPGPICTNPSDARLVGRFFSALHAAGRECGVVAAFVRLHPLRPLAEEAVAGAGTVVRHGPVAYCPLGVTPEALWSQTRPNHRSGIHKLERAGFVVQADDWSHFGGFRQAYHATMRRVGAAGFYDFSDAYFDGLRTEMGSVVHLFSVLSPAGDVAAAGLFTATDGIVEYHLGGTADAYLGHAPSKLMFHTVRAWANAAGNELLNLGGGLGGLPGPLFDFKAGFARSTADFCTLRIVLDPDRYGRLNAAARVDDGDDSGFFPRYRQRPTA